MSFLARHSVPLSETISPALYATPGSSGPTNLVIALLARGAPTATVKPFGDTATLVP